MKITRDQTAREYVLEHRDEGVVCPTCDQFAKVYRRKLNRGMSRSLITMYQIAGTDWVHVPTMLNARSREEGKLSYWGLAEESKEPREDGGRSGWWRVTRTGELFIWGSTKVQSHALVYNGKCLGLDGSEITISESLGEIFNYEELMAERPRRIMITSRGIVKNSTPTHQTR